MADKKLSEWQKAITGEWHGYPSVFEADGTYVGNNKVNRASEFKDGRTTYWMHTNFNATGPLATRFEMGKEGMRFGVIDSDDDRVYCGPDFMGAGRPFGMLVDSNYFSPGWNTDLRTVNLVLPERKLQIYSSLLYEGPTLVAAFNGIYCVTQDHDTNKETQKFVDKFLNREKELGKRQFAVPVKQSGEWHGTLEVWSPEQEKIGDVDIKIEHQPLTLRRWRQTVTLKGAINRTFSYEQDRDHNHHIYSGTEAVGNGIAYGRFLYGIKHIYGEAYKIRSRDTMLIDEGGAMAVVWNFYKSDREDCVAFGVLDWHPGNAVNTAQYVE